VDPVWTPPSTIHVLQDRDNSPTVTCAAGQRQFRLGTCSAGPWQFPHSYMWCRTVTIPPQLHVMQDRDSSPHSYMCCRTVTIPTQLYVLQNRENSSTVTCAAVPWQFPPQLRIMQMCRNSSKSRIFCSVHTNPPKVYKLKWCSSSPTVTRAAYLRRFDFKVCNWSFSNSTASAQKRARFYISHLACSHFYGGLPDLSEILTRSCWVCEILFSDIPTAWIHNKLISSLSCKWIFH
jgi:hypothetical protein